MAIALLAASLAEIAAGGNGTGWSRGAGAILAALLSTLPLAASRRLPVAAAAVVLVGSGLSIALVAPAQAPLEPFVALVLALFAVGLYARPRASAAAIAVVAAGAVGVSAADLNAGPSNTLPALIWVAVAWGFGLLLRARTRRTRELEAVTLELAAERDERERAAVAGERARIARELHDVIAHNVSVMVLHAQAGKRADAVPSAAEEALDTIEGVGRQTVDELRRLLGILRRDEQTGLAPPPSLLQLDLLAESVRQAGLAVDVEVRGERNGIPAGLDVAGYRIVQEALTNVLKHAHATRATVNVAYSADRVSLEIVDDGVGCQDGAGSGGHGLLGLRERASLYGGSLVTGTVPGGGFAVRATLLLHGDAE